MGAENDALSNKMIDFMKRKEREDGKSNIIIKGLAVNETEEKLRTKIKDFIKEKVKINVEVKYARKIEVRNMILTRIETYKQKIKIMENKKVLGKEEIYIENDRTKKEREIQRKILKVARAEKAKNKETEIKIGYLCGKGTKPRAKERLRIGMDTQIVYLNPRSRYLQIYKRV